MDSRDGSQPAESQEVPVERQPDRVASFARMADDKRAWVAELALLAVTDREEYRRVRAEAWRLAVAAKNRKIAAGSKDLN